MFVRAAEATLISRLEAQLAVERERSRRLEAQLRNLADHDPLTDLLNRRTIEHELEVHVTRCARYGPEGALLLVGLDGLDGISRELGRQESDKALAALGEHVATRLRATDVAGRWEPQELAVLLPRAAASEVAAVAEALVGLVAGTSTARVPAGSLTASVGVAPVVVTPIAAANLVLRARQAMDAARRQGGRRWLQAAG
jgi:diguanylate cyclase (GGDEF)-like protein